VFRYGIQSSVEWLCDIQKSSWPIGELPNDCSPSWVRNRGQYVCQLIHGDITPQGVMSCKSFLGIFLRCGENRAIRNRDAATTAFEVGYESASQFHREYSRLFGQPLIGDIKGLRAADIYALGIDPRWITGCFAPIL
jgi:hypothetical protein